MFKIVFFLLISSTLLFSQFREKQEDPRIKLKSENSSGITFLDMNKFSIDHSLAMSYTGSSSYSMQQNEYVMGLNYRISDPLLMRVELSASYTPYTSFTVPEDQKTDFYLKSASLIYKPFDDTFISLNYTRIKPGSLYNFNENSLFNKTLP
ncbi:MAG: hypothetical protein JXR48_14630 [Candidatus Delongbacteria bacterium]|nr:hypothetical protein [Candidatus Delongbacteria bacterium]MBN2836192.1 hypothetical protein [Candidatus Delongbacteria bacterium]